MSSPGPPLTACTIASNNYLALASVFADSYRRHHPGAEVFVGIADRPDPALDYSRFPFRAVFAEELGIPCFASFAFRYDQLELNTAIKPWLLAWLRDRQGVDRALYFDPDILVADRLVEVEAALDQHQAALTPHLTRPLDNEYRPSERKIRMAGIYNLGFLGLRLDASTAPFLAWWQERLERFCRVDPHHGTFVDQSWMDFAPAYLERVAVLRSPRLNVAYWNLAHRRIGRAGDGFTVDDLPLGFFHFSGVDLCDLTTLSKHQDRLRLAELPEVTDLLARYRELATAAGHPRQLGSAYGFAHFRPGALPIEPILRRTLLRVDPYGQRFADPFDRAAPDGFFAWLAEPLRFGLGTLTRAALAVWEDRPELVARFPNVVHHDLPGFVAWLAEARAEGRTGLPEALLAGVGTDGGDPSLRVPYQQEPLRVFLHLARPERAETLVAVDLGAPGEWQGWLLEPFPGVASTSPWLTRLALLLWERDPELQRAFRDPLGRDLDGLALFLARSGGGRFGLAPGLVSALAGRLPERLARRHPVALPEPPAATETPDPGFAAGATDPAPARASRPLGVTLIAPLRSEAGPARLARGSRAALAEAALPHAVVDLDFDLLGQSADGLFAPPEGSPWPILFTHFELRLAAWRFGWLAAAATQGGYRIGYLDWDFETLPGIYRERLAQWDEIWVPSRFALAAVGSDAEVPVRLFPPCLLDPPVPAARPEATQPVRIFASFRADDPLQRDDPWSVLAAARDLARARPARDWQLTLRIDALGDASNPTSEAAETLAALAEAAHDLPVELDHRPLTPARRAEQLAGAGLYLSLVRTGGLRPEAAEAAALGIPIVATTWGSLADWLDPESGFPVATRPSRLGRGLGPVPGSERVAEAVPEAAVEALAAALADPAEASRRAARARHRVESSFGRVAAAARWIAEVDRLRERLEAR